jgi:hypothetical protein
LRFVLLSTNIHYYEPINHIGSIARKSSHPGRE